MASSRFLPLVTKAVGIDVNERYRRQPKDLDKRAKNVIQPAKIFLEEEPTVGEWIRQLKPSKRGTVGYVRSLFPSASWISRYNLRWLMGDAIAGVTIGLVVVPQAMAYALLARLTPEFGLYTSFVGAVLYWMFGTSKDIVIGTTAVGSLLVGNVVSTVQDQYPGVYTAEEIAKAVSMMAGAPLLVFGLLRLGWIIEFIPYVPISAFVTAAAITIMSTQIPTVLGITGINTREAPYLVLTNTLKGLGRTRIDAAIGLTSIALLFFIRWFCARMEVKQPQRKKLWITLSSLRLTFTILLYTFISWLVNRNKNLSDVQFRIVGVIQSGFTHAGLPHPKAELLSIVLPQIPAIAIILIIEHIAIAKSFGRIFNYTITPSQEIVALGAANLLSPFVGGYVCTGSFGASAVLSKAGVRTPLAGMFSAMVLVLALYALTAVFYYIPNAALGGLIIHATSNLMTPPKSLYKFWQISPFELFIWIVGVLLALFISLETSIYATTGLSAALLIVRLARSKGRFLGSVRIYRVTGDTQEKSSGFHSSNGAEMSSREAFLPLDRKDGSNPDIKVDSPYPGVFLYRFSEGFNYTNQAHHTHLLLTYILRNTRRTKMDDYPVAADRLWNDPGPRSTTTDQNSFSQPILRALVLDCSAMNNVDITSVQGLLDLRNTLDRYAAPEAVEWHFASVNNRWARRALAVAGFGFPAADFPEALGNWKPAYTVAALPSENQDQARMRHCAVEEHSDHEAEVASSSETETVESKSTGKARAVSYSALAAVQGVNRPFFHVDLLEAVEIAVRDAERKDEGLVV